MFPPSSVTSSVADSRAGHRRGQGDDRYLWPAMLGAIGRCRPAWVVGENVAGIVGMELDRILADMEGAGFRTLPIIVPACALGFDQIRQRVWIVGWNDSNPISMRPQGKRKATKGSWSREQFERLVQADLRLSVSSSKSGGVSYGLPGRSHRLKGLGNAIVPQVARVILDGIAKEIEAERFRKTADSQPSTNLI